MNLAQRKYALERVDQILADKVKKAEQATRKPVKKITDKQRYSLIATGKVKLSKELDSISSYCDVVNVFDFSKYVESGNVNHDEAKPVIDSLKAEAARVRDEIMLGDAEVALALIAEFAKA